MQKSSDKDLPVPQSKDLSASEVLAQSQQLIMDQRTNGTKSFEAIVSEYKRVVRLKSADASKSISQFEKLVEKYKQSASKDLLNQIYQKVEKVEKNEKPKGMTERGNYKKRDKSTCGQKSYDFELG